MDVFDASEFHNYLRLSTILRDYGSPALRRVFRNRYKYLTNTEWTDGSQHGKDFFAQNEGKGVYKLCKGSPAQKAKLEECNLNEWDLTLLNSVLQNVDYSKGSAQIKSENTVENKEIKDLIGVRNEHAHLPGMLIVTSKFSKLWKQVEKALVTLGVLQKEIDAVRTCKDLPGIEFQTGSASEENLSRAVKLQETGQLACASKDFKNGIEQYKRALKLSGVSNVKRGEISFSLSDAYMQLLSGEVLQTEYMTQLDSAFEHAKETIELRPTWWKGYFMIGKVFQLKQEWKSAIVAYDYALGLSNNEITLVNARDECYQKIKENKNSCDDKELHENKNQGVCVEYSKNSDDPRIKGSAWVATAHQHMKGIGGYKKDYEMASRFFTKASAVGNAEALYYNGLLHKMGWGVPKDLLLARQFFEQAAGCTMDSYNEVGIIAAQNALGKCWEEGMFRGMLPNYNAAAKMYLKAFNNGSGEAANKLADLYKDGQGVEKNQLRAMEYYKIAAKKGVAIAMETLAWEYLASGDLGNARSWYSQSIDAGNFHSILYQSSFEEEVRQKSSQEPINLEPSKSTAIDKRLEKDTSEKTDRHFDLTILVEDAKSVQSDQHRMQMNGLAGLFSEDSESEEDKNVASFAAASNASCKEDKLQGKHDDNGLSNSDSTTPSISVSCAKAQQLSNRISVVVNHRQGKTIKIVNDKLSNLLERSSAQNHGNTQTSIMQLIGLKEIFLDGLKSDVDKIYSGFVIKVTIAEECIFNYYPLVQTVVKDEKGDYQFCYFICGNERLADTKGKLRLGSIISLLNPNYRVMAADLHGILVNISQDIFFHNHTHRTGALYCRFCMTPTPLKKCSKCKKAWYCNQECQKADWEKLKHKFICK